MRAQLGSDAECYELFEALERLSREGVRALRVNPLREGGLEFIREILPLGAPIAWEPRAFLVAPEILKKSSTDLHIIMGAGLAYLQEPGAMEAVALLDPRPGESGLDLCAAPGGKSTQILERLGSEGWLVSNEINRARAARLDALVARHGSERVSVYSAEPETIADQFAGAFDFALIDAPCSGESLFGKREERRRDVGDGEVRGCARRQMGILAAAARTLRAGGRLVYSTCTYSAEENESVVRGFLDAHPDWRLDAEARRWPHRDGIPGGYAARLLHMSAPSAARGADFATLSPPPRGLVRHGLVRWDGEVDSYAAALASRALARTDDIELGSAAEALRYLRGESLPMASGNREAADVRVRWRGWVLGPGRRVEGRINNLLPKILRVA
jgi:16S rRNA C967 or C1407 C5-methylase (RsmB/RsmF family)